jgi:taurine dioxygenase
MIYFRDQVISHEDQEAFAVRFGEFAVDAYTSGTTGHRNVQPLIKEAESRADHIFGSGWHSDSPFLEHPPSVTMLRAVQVPPYGGDTMWANAALAYASLSETMKSLLAELQVHMSMRNVFDSVRKHGDPKRDNPVGRLASLPDEGSLPDSIIRNLEGCFHPLVNTHRHTEEKALYCDPSYAVGIRGMTDQEAEPILDFLATHITQPAFTCRLRWSPGTVALWDNRLCVHQAFNDYDGYRREFYRCIVYDHPA